MVKLLSQFGPAPGSTHVVTGAVISTFISATIQQVQDKLCAHVTFSMSTLTSDYT